jgi:NAD(P)-dependent dehydrogenase (short-subunit alcohol dehydrogenase family)
VNISSIGGRVAVPLLGAYNMSKFGLEAFSDVLRRELRPQGVDVIAIEPGGIKTHIWRKGGEVAEEIRAGTPPEGRELYGAIVAAIRKRSAHIEQVRGLPPRAVAEVIGTALTADRPRARYLVGKDAKARALVARVLPDRVMDRLMARALGG